MPTAEIQWVFEKTITVKSEGVKGFFLLPASCFLLPASYGYDKMKVYIERIPEEGLLLEGEEYPEILQIQGDREKFEENIQVEVRAFKVSGNLIVIGRIATHVDLICSNCLERFNDSIENEKFSYDCEILGRDVIDMTDPIREDVIMGLPLRPLCRENCKGLCPQCGQNLNLASCRCQKSKKKEKIVQGGPFDVLDQLKPKK